MSRSPDARRHANGFGFVAWVAALVVGGCATIDAPATKLQALRLNANGLVPNMIGFNVGVEIGQLIFIAVVLGALKCAGFIRLSAEAGLRARSVAAYAIGITAAYWSLISLLGSRIDSSKSRTLKRPETMVRSGP